MAKAFVYTEMQLSIPVDQAPWRELKPLLQRQPGLSNRTWLSGDRSQSVGGFYEFETLEQARASAKDDFPTEAKRLGGSFTTRVFDGAVTDEASRQMGSPYY